MPAKALAVRRVDVRRAEKYLGQSWPAITAADVILASRMGDARAYEGKFNYRREALAALALGEAVEAKGRFLTDIANLCFMICEESAWTAPANLRRPDGSPAYLPDIERPLLDMAAARTGALMATVLHLHRDKLREISPAIAVRIEREITLRVIDPFINVKQLEFARARGEDDMLPEGVKECLTALLLIEREDRFRWGGVKRALRLMDAYLDELPRDGGIPGGLGAFERGVGCIMEALELICEASGGNVSFFTVSALRNVSDFIIGSHISLDYFNCAGNCPAHWDVDPNLIYRCGELLRSDELCSLGAYLMGLRGGDSRPVWPLMRAARAAIGENEMLRHDSRPPMPMDYYLRSGALLTARTRAGAADGFFISIEGGANRMGGHADAGNVTLYWNGEPVLPDLGEIEYASQLAPDERAALWETQSQYHNLPANLPDADYSTLDDAEAQDIVRLLEQFPKLVKEAAQRNEPSLITRYTVDLAQAYNKFYYEHRILDCEPATSAARIAITKAVRDVIGTGLTLIGVEPTEKM